MVSHLAHSLLNQRLNPSLLVRRILLGNSQIPRTAHDRCFILLLPLSHFFLLFIGEVRDELRQLFLTAFPVARSNKVVLLRCWRIPALKVSGSLRLISHQKRHAALLLERLLRRCTIPILQLSAQCTFLSFRDLFTTRPRIQLYWL